jgi:predicted  nucleic acid-binding Zn-ribbon protein
MAKKKNKKDKKDSAPSDPVEAVRAAVERTFHATTDSAAGTQKRTRQLVDEVTHAAARIRATIEELRVLDEVKGLRNDIEALARRVAALESSTAAKPPAARSSAKSTAGSRAKPATARKPRTTRSSPSSSASTRSRSARSSGGSSS